MNNVGLKKKIRKYVEYITTKICLLLEQKKYTENNITYKYMLKENVSDTLIVVLSSCTRKGLRARYNYVKTLKPVNAYKLFILDDFAKDHRGGYYVGSNCKFDEEKVVIHLIENIIKKTGAKHVIFAGSSKGGWSALNLGLQFENADIVVGGPQYFLGSYLISSENFDTLEHIIGERTDEKMNMIDNYLKERIDTNKYKNTQRIFIHYSDQEHTYREHIKDLVQELSENEYQVVYDIAKYENHSDISYYFPDFLLKTCEKIMSKNV